MVGFMVSVAKGGLLVRHAVENHPGGARERDASVGLGWGMGVDFESLDPALVPTRRGGDTERSPVLHRLKT